MKVGAWGIERRISGKKEHRRVLKGNGFTWIGCFFTKKSWYIET